MFIRAAIGLCVIAFPTLLLSGCGGGLSASSTCRQFLAASQEDQEKVVLSMYEKAHPSYTGLNLRMGAANAVLNVSYTCGEQPAVSLSTIDL